ncbi:MAG: putative Kef-type K+ transport protein [Gammaproteobacteria bacterium]
MIAIALAAAFVGGLLARLVGLPPLVGFLLAGFALRQAGFEPDVAIEGIAHAGVLVLLFSVGLKLRLKNLASAEVLCGALLHILLFGTALALVLVVSAAKPLSVAFIAAAALSLSSTVVAAKVLEEKRELRAFHGRVAIGILIIQDVIAVSLLSAVTGVAPSWWGLALIVVMITGVPIFHRLLQWSGHGEMVVVFGLTMTLSVGGALFTTAGLSAELGALLIGAVVASHPGANELSYRLWALKEILLVGFFVSIGMAVDPDFDTVLIAVLLVALLPVKAALFFALLVRFRLRARSSFLAAVALASFSEFGLIVAKLMHDVGLLDDRWLTVIGLAAAFSFIVAAPLNRMSHQLFERWRGWLVKLERAERHPDDKPISVGSAEIVVFGMGRVGTGAYEYLRSQHARVVGFDSDPGKVERHIGAGRRVVYADAEDPDLWERLSLDGVRGVLLALPDLEAKIMSVHSLRRHGFQGFITATNVFEAETQPILDAGCDATFNYFEDAGFGFAKHSWDALNLSERTD